MFPVSSYTALKSSLILPRAFFLLFSSSCSRRSPRGSSSEPFARAFMEGLPGIFGQAAAARRRPVLGRASTAPAARPSLLAGVSNADRRAKAMHKFAKLEGLINRVQTSPRPFTSLAWSEKIEPELREARRAEQQASMVPVTNDPRPERDLEEIEAFVEATDTLKNSVDLVSCSYFDESPEASLGVRSRR